jgi:ketosteroid isomerase-like protein
MSKRNVETVRRIYEGFPAIQDGLRRGEIPISDPFAEDVEWDASEIGLPDLGDGKMRGREGVRRFWIAWLAAWEDVTFDYELRDAGERVVALIDQRMRGSEEIELLMERYAQVWTFKDGEVVSWKMYRDWQEAAEAAGLSE